MIDTTVLVQFFQIVFMPLVSIVAGAVFTLTLASVFIILFNVLFLKENV